MALQSQHTGRLAPATDKTAVVLSPPFRSPLTPLTRKLVPVTWNNAEASSLATTDARTTLPEVALRRLRLAASHSSGDSATLRE